jgi:cyclase
MKKRIIPTLLIDGGGKVVTSHHFSPWRTVGLLMQSLRLHDQREADELLILDINARMENRIISNRILEKISENLKIPVTVGGGISGVEIAKHYIFSGADKVCLNSHCLDNPGIVEALASNLGAQAVVVKVDYVWHEGSPRIFDYRDKSLRNIDFMSYLQQLTQSGCGELILSAVANDGTFGGFDTQILSYLDGQSLTVPLILSGGAGCPSDFAVAFATRAVSGLSASSIFAFSEHTPKTIRAFCSQKGVPMRRI